MTATQEYIEIRERYEAAQAKADEAFRRYFQKREAGEPTNGAAWQRMENEANAISADMAVAEGRVWDEADTDPDDIWRDHVARRRKQLQGATVGQP